jgi:RAQPRD family integrative conjugative element protein
MCEVLMKVKSLLIMALYLCSINTSALANEEKEKMYLIQMINQLDALKPLVIAASNEQQENSRQKFNYTAFVNSSGKSQNGLLEDINELKKGIQARLNKTETEPHRFEAIKGDYISNHHSD